MMTPTEFPLAWPMDRPRTALPIKGQFQTTLRKAVENVNRSLRLLGRDTSKPIDLARVVISSNVGGLSGREPSDPAVAVYFHWDGQPQCVACDRYRKVAHNLQAIHRLLECRREDYRHGGLHFLRATFKGHKALPAPPGQGDPFAVLGLARTASRDEVRAAAKSLALSHHPDRPGGSADKMAEINAARDQALAEAEA